MKIKQLKETMDALIHAAMNMPKSDYLLITDTVIKKIMNYLNNFSDNYKDMLPVEDTENIIEYKKKRVEMLEPVCERDDKGIPILINGQYKIDAKKVDTTLLKEKELSLLREYEKDLEPYKHYDNVMYWFYENHSVSDEELAYIFGPEINEDVRYVFPLKEEAEKNIINNLE